MLINDLPLFSVSASEPDSDLPVVPVRGLAGGNQGQPAETQPKEQLGAGLRPQQLQQPRPDPVQRRADRRDQRAQRRTVRPGRPVRSPGGGSLQDSDPGPDPHDGPDT